MLLASLLLFGFEAITQVQVLTFPEDNQLIPRLSLAPSATLTLTGVVAEASGAVSVRAQVESDADSVWFASQALSFQQGEARFSLELKVPVTRHNHVVELYLNNSNTPIARAENIVAGDVFVVNGQSNAEASYYIDPTDRDPFLRGYNDSQAVDVGSHPGWTELAFAAGGTWMGRTANALSQELDLPLAVFNFAKGGQPLDYFEPGNASGNYTRVMNTLASAGVAGQVHSFYWSQGEADGFGRPITSYRLALEALFTQYRSAIGTNHFYQWQTRPFACSAQTAFVPEAQRQLARKLDYLTLVSTLNAQAETDQCHFPYPGGRAVLGNRLSKVLLNDLYGKAQVGVVSPDVDSARITALNEITVYFSTAGNALMNTGSPWGDFVAEGVSLAPVSGALVGDHRVVLTFGQDIRSATGLSYHAHVEQRSDYLHNVAGIGVLTFYNLSLERTHSNQGTAPDLELNLRGPATLPGVGDQFTVDMLLVNLGDQTATGLSVEFDNGSGLDLIGTTTLAAGASLDPNTRLWVVPSVGAKDSARVGLLFRRVNAGSRNVFAQLETSDQADEDSSPNNANFGEVREDDEAYLIVSDSLASCNLKVDTLGSQCLLDSFSRVVYTYLVRQEDPTLVVPQTTVPNAILAVDQGRVEIDVDFLRQANGPQELIFVKTGTASVCEARFDLEPRADCLPISTLCDGATASVVSSACDLDSSAIWQLELTAGDTSRGPISYDLNPATAVLDNPALGSFRLSIDSLRAAKATTLVVAMAQPVTSAVTCRDTLRIDPPVACSSTNEQCASTPLIATSSLCGTQSLGQWEVSLDFGGPTVSNINVSLFPQDALFNFFSLDSFSVDVASLELLGTDSILVVVDRELNSGATCLDSLWLEMPSECLSSSQQCAQSGVELQDNMCLPSIANLWDISFTATALPLTQLSIGIEPMRALVDSLSFGSIQVSMDSLYAFGLDSVSLNLSWLAAGGTVCLDTIQLEAPNDCLSTEQQCLASEIEVLRSSCAPDSANRWLVEIELSDPPPTEPVLTVLPEGVTVSEPIMGRATIDVDALFALNQDSIHVAVDRLTFGGANCIDTLVLRAPAGCQTSSLRDIRTATKQRLRVFPNPVQRGTLVQLAGEELRLSPTKSVQLFDITGVLRLEHQAGSSLDTSELPPGLYHLVVDGQRATLSVY